MKTKHYAIMLTDIKGFTSRTAASSRSETMEMLQRHKELVTPVIQKHSGRVVKTIGDAFLVVFESPTDAVLCGIEIQDALKAHNTEKAGHERIEIRIAINSGEVTVSDDGDIFGDAVNITARLESIAEVGQVFFTEAVYLAMNKKEVPSSEIGYRQFKGVPEKIKVFRVLREVPVGAQPPGDAAPEQVPAAVQPQAAEPVRCAKGVRRFASLALDVIIVMIVLHTFGLSSCGPRAKWSTTDHLGDQDIEVSNVQVNADGVTIKGGDGQVVRVSKDGVEAGGKKFTRTKKREFGFDPGTGGSGKEVPLKMLLWALYSGIFLWRFGVTPGMRIMKLKLVEFPSGGPVPADKTFLRAFFSLVSLFGLLGYVWALWEKDHRTWHDIIAGTAVVNS